jgi:hypothetical protein
MAMAIKLERIAAPFTPDEDRRPKIEQPPPVRLVAVDDCRLSAPAGLEHDLDNFYIGLLRFARLDDPHRIVYRAENHDLYFEVLERPEPRQDMRALGIAVPSLADLIQRLNHAEISYLRLRGLSPGMNCIALYDPAQNPLEISQYGLVI